MKREHISFSEFIDTLDNTVYPNRNKHLRKGQALMIYLDKIWAEESNRITKENRVDPFYTDNTIPLTIMHLSNVWDNRDRDIAYDTEEKVDRSKNKVMFKVKKEINLVDFAKLIIESTNPDDLPQLIALIVSNVNDKTLYIPLINHFEYLKNVYYYNSDDINKPCNLLP